MHSLYYHHPVDSIIIPLAYHPSTPGFVILSVPFVILSASEESHPLAFAIPTIDYSLHQQ